MDVLLREQLDPTDVTRGVLLTPRSASCGEICSSPKVSISFFEIYGGRPYDLLNNRSRLETLEDARGEVQIAGLTERTVGDAAAMLLCIELGNSLRAGPCRRASGCHRTRAGSGNTTRLSGNPVFLDQMPGPSVCYTEVHMREDDAQLLVALPTKARPTPRPSTATPPVRTRSEQLRLPSSLYSKATLLRRMSAKLLPSTIQMQLFIAGYPRLYWVT